MEILKIAGSVLLVASVLAAQTVNCVVAVVNGRLITLVDVQIVVAFGLSSPLPEAEGDDPLLVALDRLIDQKVVLDMAREARSAGRDETMAALGEVRRRLGGDEFARRLRKLGLQEQDLSPYLEESLLLERALAVRFGRGLPVPRLEIERHYREVYAPEQARRGLSPEPLDRVAGHLEARIRERSLKGQIEAWIKGLRARADIRINKDCLRWLEKERIHGTNRIPFSRTRFPGRRHGPGPL